MRISILLCLLLAGAAAVFTLWPQIDVSVASAFYAKGQFAAAHSRLWETVRRLFYLAPYALLVALAALSSFRSLGWTASGPQARSMVYLAATLALGPGLLVNVILKDFSHRPRPVQVAQFGGAETFRPWYRFDGACRTNCSFVSGETSAAFWTSAPAMLAPPQFRVPALTAALAFGVAVSALRVAFGGHFLSDTVFAALLTLLIVAATARWILAPSRPTSRKFPRSEPRNLRGREPTL